MRPLQLTLFPTETGRARRGPSTSAPLRIDSVPLAVRLSSLLRESVDVELTDNAWTMVSYRRRAGRLCFRLHHMFGFATEAVVKALAAFTGRARKASGRAIDDYIRQNRHLIRPVAGRPEPELCARGRVHDLSEILAALNARHFRGRVDARIGWGRRSRLRRRLSIKMGVYFHERKLIKIHPALDDARVPRHFVEMVVFHEMLHQVIPPRADRAGRRCVHGREFRAAERAFPHYQRARAWEKANLSLLLRQRA